MYRSSAQTRLAVKARYVLVWKPIRLNFQTLARRQWQRGPRTKGRSEQVKASLQRLLGGGDAEARKVERLGSKSLPRGRPRAVWYVAYNLAAHYAEMGRIECLRRD